MLIGSRALKHWVSDFKVRDNSDWDIIGNKEDENYYRTYFLIPVNDRVEFHDTDILNNKEMLGFSVCGVCSLEGLKILYRSHLHRPDKFASNITKYHKFIVPNYNEDISDRKEYITRKELTLKKFKQGKPSLNKTNEDFFDDAVDKVYDHDFLHELYAYFDRPIYTQLKRDDSLAWCERSLWESLSPDIKIKCVAEETYVIATERFLVPTDWKYNAKIAYLKSLEKVCTTLTSGWFRDFAIDSYDKVYQLYDFERFYKTKFMLDNYLKKDIKYHNKV